VSSRKRSAAHSSASPAHGGKFPIVGIGASAGGLEALTQLLAHLPATSGAAFVVVQHLDPSHDSILTEILQRGSPMPVTQVEDQMPVVPDHVYVIPPNRDLAVFHDTLQLSAPAEQRGQRMPIDSFFRSLAEDKGADAIGIILSGTGTDGTLGLRAILGAGGLSLVQDPSTAKYDGMPKSAIEAGYASQVLAPDQMHQALPPLAPLPRAPLHVGRQDLNRVFRLLRSGTGHDFSQYKKSTIDRRIERRMMLHKIESVEVYARYLQDQPAELLTLFRELLINVTCFFRDPEAFELIKTEILPPLLAGKGEGDTLRLWVAGCASGEEAYSMAILLRELMDAADHELHIQLYATDLDDEAIAFARAGLYLPNIVQDVSPERLRRFFTKEEAGFRVRKEIRDMVVFAVQSVIKDPPFTRLDMLSCRNLLIYLEPELQDRLIPTFHYALKPGGVLFLSPSESISKHTELFEAINRKWKLYRSLTSPASSRTVLSSGLSWTHDGVPPEMPETEHRPKEPPIAEMARRMLMQSFAPAAVVTDMQGDILYVHGDTGKFLRLAPGKPRNNVIEMACAGLQLELREAVRLASGQGQATMNRGLNIKTAQGHAESVNLSVQLMPDPERGHSVLLVSFQEQPNAAPGQAGREPRSEHPAEAAMIDELERELTYAKASMNAALEDQQASNEELKSANEELQTTNEELQSTNEELETSKEELQSVNEELVTVNSELQTKIEQMACMQDDMKNLLENVRIGTIFLDRQMHIRRFTRDAASVYRLVASDVGRSLADIRSHLQDDDLLVDAQTVLDSLIPVEREVCTLSGTWYVARIRPYRTVDNVIDGVVLTFSDVTERVHAIAERKARSLAEAIVDTVQKPLVVLDAGLTIMSANRAFYERFGGSAIETLGQSLFSLGGGRWDVPQVRTLLEPAVPGQAPNVHRTTCLPPAEPGTPPLRLTAQHITGQTDGGKLVLLSIENDLST
jgi:two-component system CheB/CheR fusion protein